MRLGGLGAGSQAKLINNTMFAAQVVLADDALKVGETLWHRPGGARRRVLGSSSSSCIAWGC